MLENTPQTNSLYVKIEELLKSIPELVTEEMDYHFLIKAILKCIININLALKKLWA